MGQQATLKATNRQIRRAFGSEAVDAITSRDQEIRATARVTMDLDARVSTSEQRLTALGQQHDRLNERFESAQRELEQRIQSYFARLPWYRRLRLIVRGR